MPPIGQPSRNRLQARLHLPVGVRYVAVRLLVYVLVGWFAYELAHFREVVQVLLPLLVGFFVPQVLARVRLLKRQLALLVIVVLVQLIASLVPVAFRPVEPL